MSHERYADGDRGRRRRGRRARPRPGSPTAPCPGFRDVEAALAEQPDTLPDDRAAGAAMHYTSGTTGKPKGVKRKLNDVDPDVMAELFTGFFSLFGIPHREDQVHLCTSPNYHTAVTTFAGNALNSGHRVVFMDKWDPAETLAKIERYSVTHTHMVPTQFHRMLQLPDDVKAKYDVSSMRWAIHAAAPCPIDVKQKMLDWWGPVIWEYYGATEGGGTTATPEDWLKYPGTVGSPWAISELKITDDDGSRVDAGRARHRLDEDGRPGLRVQGRQVQDRREPRRRRASSPSATSATSTRTASCSSATARAT